MLFSWGTRCLSSPHPCRGLLNIIYMALLRIREKNVLCLNYVVAVFGHEQNTCLKFSIISSDSLFNSVTY